MGVTDTHATAPFRFEADMLRGIATAPANFLGKARVERGVSTFFEFWGTQGAPDVLFVEFDRLELSRRTTLGLPAVTDYSQACVLSALAARPRSAAELAPRVRLSRSYLQRTVLPSLSDLGWVVEGLDRRWQSPEPIAPIARSIVAIEAKRRDWSGALDQAGRYRDFAHRSVVVLDATVRVERATARARREHIGLGVLAADSGRVRSLYLPPWRAPRRPAEFLVVCERALAMLWSSTFSGPVLPVFGRVLLASEDDPRLIRLAATAGTR